MYSDANTRLGEAGGGRLVQWGMSTLPRSRKKRSVSLLWREAEASTQQHRTQVRVGVLPGQWRILFQNLDPARTHHIEHLAVGMVPVPQGLTAAGGDLQTYSLPLKTISGMAWQFRGGRYWVPKIRSPASPSPGNM